MTANMSLSSMRMAAISRAFATSGLATLIFWTGTGTKFTSMTCMATRREKMRYRLTKEELWDSTFIYRCMMTLPTSMNTVFMGSSLANLP
jgi:hypothetical protein